eukprot:1142553-Pelagomonas_calceolata.AAC.10
MSLVMSLLHKYHPLEIKYEESVEEPKYRNGSLLSLAAPSLRIRAFVRKCRLTVLNLLAAEGLELQSFIYHPAFFLVAGPVFFLCLPCFSQSELRGWVVMQSLHQCGPLVLIDVGSVFTAYIAFVLSCFVLYPKESL